MKIDLKDSGVSPVIGTILLVAITVVLVAIIAAVVMGMSGGMNSKEVGLTVTPNKVQFDDGGFGTADYPYFTVIVYGGRDVSQLRSLEISLEGDRDVVYIEPSSINSGRLEPVYAYEWTVVEIPVSELIGRPIHYAPRDTDPDSPPSYQNALYTVTGIFADGTSQVLYTGRVTFERHSTYMSSMGMYDSSTPLVASPTFV